MKLSNNDGNESHDVCADTKGVRYIIANRYYVYTLETQIVLAFFFASYYHL